MVTNTKRITLVEQNVTFIQDLPLLLLPITNHIIKIKMVLNLTKHIKQLAKHIELKVIKYIILITKHIKLKVIHNELMVIKHIKLKAIHNELMVIKHIKQIIKYIKLKVIT